MYANKLGMNKHKASGTYYVKERRLKNYYWLIKLSRLSIIHILPS